MLHIAGSNAEPRLGSTTPSFAWNFCSVFMRGPDTLSQRVCSWILPGMTALFLRIDLCLRGLAAYLQNIYLILIIFLREGLCVHA